MDPQHYLKLMKILAMTNQGLTLEELRALVPCTSSQWKYYIFFIKGFLILQDGLWTMGDHHLRILIQEQLIASPKERMLIHELFHVVFEDATHVADLRSLDEQASHLY